MRIISERSSMSRDHRVPSSRWCGRVWPALRLGAGMVGLAWAFTYAGLADASQVCRPEDPELPCTCRLRCSYSGTCPSAQCEEEPSACLALLQQELTGWKVAHTYCLGSDGEVVVGPPGAATLSASESGWLRDLGICQPVVRWPSVPGHRLAFGGLWAPNWDPCLFSTYQDSNEGWIAMPELAYRCGGAAPFQLAVKAFLSPENQCRAALANYAHCFDESCVQASAPVLGDGETLCSAKPCLSPRTSDASAASVAALLLGGVWMVRRRRRSQEVAPQT